MPIEIIEKFTPSLPDPTHAPAEGSFTTRYIDPLRVVMHQLATLCLVCTWMRAQAQATLDSLLWIDDRGNGLAQAERRCLGHSSASRQIRRAYVVNVLREAAIGELVGRCTQLRSLVAEEPFKVALPPTCHTLIMPAFYSPGALQCTLAAVIQLRCLRMPRLDMSKLDAHMAALIASCPDLDIGSLWAG